MVATTLGQDFLFAQGPVEEEIKLDHENVITLYLEMVETIV